MAQKVERSTRVPLLGGSYTSSSLIADAQRCVNLFPEVTANENQSPTPVAHLLTPGLTTLITPKAGTVRCIYRASNGVVYMVIDDSVYSIAADYGSSTLIGSIISATTPVSMMDNGIVAVIVDATLNTGWVFGLSGTPAFGLIVDAAFYGSYRVQFLDGFFVFVRPNSNQFYLSPPFWDGVAPFDPTYIASKTGGPDAIQTISVIKGDLWLIGFYTTEVWYNAGNADFPFARQPGVFIQHGTLAPYSVGEADIQCVFLGIDPQGTAVVFKGQPYEAVRISNHALENALKNKRLTDAIGFLYQQGGHLFYVLTFPTANMTWVYDFATNQWHERTWTNPADGSENRIRGSACWGSGYFDYTLVGDRLTGALYRWNPDAYTDNGDPIVRRRGFPHIVNGSDRLSHNRFVADLEVDAAAAAASASLSLRWSDTRGATYGTPVALSLGGAQTAGLRSLLWTRLGMARDRVYELSWNFPYKTSLQGCWLDIDESET